MTTHVAVLPSIWQPWTDECLRTVHFEVMVVDNTVENIGTGASWNRGIDKMRAEGADWLILVSAALRFGEPGGFDFLDALDAHADHLVVEAHGVFGWHLIAFHRRCVEALGRFDCNFFPYGCDDIDWSLRFQKHYEPGWPTYPRPDDVRWTKVPVDVEDMGMAHSIKLAGLDDKGHSIRYYREKWGGDKGQEQFATPYGNPGRPLAYWTSTPRGAWDD
jgi:hypothetical protein